MTNYSNVAAAAVLTSSPSNVAGSITVDTTTGFPAAPFTLALDYDTGLEELVSVTGVSGLTLTVTRGYDATTAVGHTAGAVVRHVFTAKDFRDSRTHEAATAAHGATGEVMGTTNAQAVINKDLSSGSNTFPSSLATLTGSQVLTHKDLTDASNTFPSSMATEAEVTAAITTHAAATATHGVSGAIVGTNDTQVLTNKDLTDASNTLPTSVVTLTGSQTLTNKSLTSPVITGVGSTLVALKASDTSRTGTTLTADPELTVAVEANASYLVDVFWLTNASNRDIRVQLVVPTGAASTVGIVAPPASAVDGTTPRVTLVSTASYTGIGGIGVDVGTVGSGFLTVGSTAGSLTVQMAISNGPGSGTMRAGSFIRLRRVV